MQKLCEISRGVVLRKVSTPPAKQNGLHLTCFRTLNHRNHLQRTNQELQRCIKQKPISTTRTCEPMMQDAFGALCPRKCCKYHLYIDCRLTFNQTKFLKSPWKRALFSLVAVHTGCCSPPVLLSLHCLCHLEPAHLQKKNEIIRTATAVPMDFV